MKDEAARAWLGEIGRSVPRKRVKLQCLRRHVPELAPGEEGADIGTGNGALALHLHRGAGWTFVDASAEHLDIAKRLVHGEFHAGDAIAFLRRPANEGRFSVITCVDSIFYFPSPADLLAACAKALRPGGRLVVSGMDRVDGVVDRLRSRLGVAQSVGEVTTVGGDDARRAIEAAGLRVVGSHRYLGPGVFALQTIVDIALLRRSGTLLPSAGDGLTKPSFAKRLALAALRTATVGGEALDAVLPVKGLHAFVVVAERPR